MTHSLGTTALEHPVRTASIVELKTESFTVSDEPDQVVLNGEIWLATKINGACANEAVRRQRIR